MDSQPQPQARPEQPRPPPSPPPPSPPPRRSPLVVATNHGRVALLRVKPGAAALGVWGSEARRSATGTSPPGTPSKQKAVAPRAPPPPLPPPPPPPPRLSLPAPLLLLWSSGLACGLLSALLSVGGNLLVKALDAPSPPLMQVVLMRSLTSLLLTLGLGALAATKPLSGHKTTRPFLAALGVLGAFAMALWYVSLEHLPLGDAVVISLVGPPLTALLAFFLLKEALGWVGAAGCLAAFAGVVVVSQPPFLFGETETSPTSPSPLSSTHGHALGVGAGVLAALATSCAMLAIRRIGGSEPAIVVTLAFHVASVAMGSASLLLGIPAPPQHPSSRNAGLLVTTGAVTFIAQLLVTRSFQLLPAAVAASLAFTGVAYAYLAGAVFFGEKLALPAALGTVLITSGVALATLRRPPPKTAAVAEAGVVVAVPLQGAAAITLPSRRRLITQHSITACGDGGALFGTDLFVAVEPPQTGAVAADAHPLLLPPASSPSTATASPFAAPVAPAALADEPTALEALAADPLVAAAARLYTRASMSFRRQGSVGGTSLSRGGSASSSLAALRQISSLVRRVDKEEAAATVVAAAPEAAALVPAAATAAIDDKDDQT